MAPLAMSAIRATLTTIAVFTAVSALTGMIGLTAGGGIGMPIEYAAPFPSFVIPGLILGLVVGGTQAWSALTLIRRSAHAPLATAVAGFGMQLWIVVELAMILEFSWLQVLYFTTGTAQLALAFGMLGVAPRAIDHTWYHHVQLHRGEPRVGGVGKMGRGTAS